MPETVRLVSAIPQDIAVVRVTTDIARWPSEFGRSLDKIWSAVRAGSIPKPGRNVMVYRGRSDGLVDIECGAEMHQAFEPVGEIVLSRTPAGFAATLTHKGPYNQLGQSHRAIENWMRENGHRYGGTCWEVYGHWQPDESRLETGIFYLLETV